MFENIKDMSIESVGAISTDAKKNSNRQVCCNDNEQVCNEVSLHKSILKQNGLGFERIYNLDELSEFTNKIEIFVLSQPNIRKSFSLQEIVQNANCLNDLCGMIGKFDLDVYGIQAELKDQFKLAKPILCNKKIEMDTYNNKSIYKLNGVIGTSDCSRYTGDLALGEKGNIFTFKQLVSKEIEKNAYLSLAMILAMYGFVLDIISNRDFSIKFDSSDLRLAVNFMGKSSIGKSSATMLTLSAVGRPSELMVNYNNTDKKLNDLMMQYGACPFVIDDFLVGRTNSKVDIIKALTMLFNFQQGQMRGRVTNEKNSLNSTSVTNAVILSTEESILALSNDVLVNTQGQKARLIEIQCKQGDLFQSDAQCNEFKAIINQNYGIWGKEVISYIMANRLDNDWIANKLNQYYDSLCEELSESSIQSRYAKRVALILTTGCLINEALQVHLDLNAVRSLLINSIKKGMVKPKYEAAYDRLNSYVQSNASCFCTNLKELWIPSEREQNKLIQAATESSEKGIHLKNKKTYMGAIVKGSLYIDNYYLNSILEDKCRDILTEWSKRELLSSPQVKNATSDSGFTRKVTVANRRARLYIIKLNCDLNGAA